MFIGLSMALSAFRKAGSAIVATFYRLTESGDRRVTEDGNIRRVE